ncbi:Sec1-like protein [Fomitopsis betulina]|nr:Sec1-like protein [Fomitopsis betulina]
MTSLLTTVRSRFLNAIRSVNPPGRWKILVVDEHSQQLLGSVLKQFDILEENVTLIESITNYREPQPGFEAMYLVMSTSQNVDRIIRDFSDGSQQYAAAHLFFVDGLDEQLFERLTSSAAEPFLKTLQELFINFWAIESQAFSLKLPGAFFNIYSPPRSESAFQTARERLEEELRLVSKMLVNVCVSLHEYPYIRYYFPTHHPPLGAFKPHETTRAPPPPENSGRWRTQLARGEAARAYEVADTDFVTKVLAFMVQKDLDEYKKANPEWPKASDPPRPRATMIITDRAMDTLAPFIHEFTYQAMANDLLPIDEGTKYGYKFQGAAGQFEDKVAVLSDADNVWTELRHMHMREAIDKLMADFNRFMQDNAGMKGDGAASLNDMKDMLANLPQYQEQREKFSLHLNMAQECMALFESAKLTNVATVEQNCATGLTPEGKTPKTLVEQMVPLLDSREVINANKVRMIALYIQYRDGVPDEDRRRLYQHARLSMAEQDAVNALLHFGVRVTKGPGDKDTRKRLRHKSNQDDEYELSRFKPLLQTVLEEHIRDRLDQTLFPYVKDAPVAAPISSGMRSPPPIAPATSLRSAKPSWHRGPKAANAREEVRQRVIVFMAGGMTYSEMREVYLLSKALNKDIIIGSTHTLTPGQFVDDLKVLDLGGIGSKAIPNGLGESKGRRPLQEAYDEKYYTRDAPRPQRQAAPPTQTRDEKGRLHRPSIPSFAGSTMSVNSTSSKSEGKKKRGLFHF